jgi:hypothetical protein
VVVSPVGFIVIKAVFVFPLFTILPVPNASVLAVVTLLLNMPERRVKLAKLSVPASKAMDRFDATKKSEASVHVPPELLKVALQANTTPLVSIVFDSDPPKVMAAVEDHTAVDVRVNA